MWISFRVDLIATDAALNQETEFDIYAPYMYNEANYSKNNWADISVVTVSTLRAITIEKWGFKFKWLFLFIVQ